MNVTFCINTCKNELDHLNLLLHSMARNFVSRDHEILVFVDSDKDDKITNYLRFMHKETFPNLKIIKNVGPIPVGYATNINHMFEMASHEIVSYIQSDMVICPNYDVEILKHLTPNMVLSSTRIEPPLHPPGPEKHVADFGTDPSAFDLEKFNSLSEGLKKNHITNHFFAPFTLYKKCWLAIGGHDVSFRRSREDSDVVWRLLLSGVEIKQCWNALVYHFTCTSSRGNGWWKNNTREVQVRTATQMQADQIEMMKFVRKWGTFKHPSNSDEAKHYKYSVDAVIHDCDHSDLDVLINLFPVFRKISIDKSELLPLLKERFDALQKPANFLFGISDDDWSKYGKYYSQTKFEDVYCTGDIPAEFIRVDFSIKSALFNSNLSVGITNIQSILNDNVRPGETGTFDMAGAQVTVNQLKNTITDNIYIQNPKYDMELEIL
jgi:GT2 family glycosyltransferase